ncbi:lipid-A-disaccharide synthase [Bizionia sediminis]|uniref:Lipid-A-disaccharide synthase n=1 Tax=Bizionia sediminis TaxID=1737064 RepID=A0ABW5KWH8_9FLAO
MKYYLIAGEASGDLHGSNLMKALKNEDPQAEFQFWGGDLMQAVGGTLVKHYKERSFMGFAEVILNLNTIRKDFKRCKNDIKQYQPDVIIFIDNSGFNLRIAKWAKQAGFKTHYYISPQVWASRAGRVKAIKRDIDAMYVILPFVKTFYEAHQYPVHFVGHPLIDAISNRHAIKASEFKNKYGLQNKPIIALLPGSRKQEIAKMLSVMLTLVPKYPNYQFVIAGAPSQDFSFYQSFIKAANIHFISNKTYDILSVATAALVTSGTATLEAALFKVPQVVCYKGSWLSYQIGKRLITHINFISLVNLVMDKAVVTELIQDDFTAENLKTELDAILNNNNRVQMLEAYNELEKKLGGTGASAKTAKLIYKALNS